MNHKEVVICNPVRTAVGTYGGSLKEVPAPDLGAVAIRETIQRSALTADKVQTLVMGIVAVEVPVRKGVSVFNKDEHNRIETTPETLVKLKPAFRQDGTITAGNSPGLNSGAAAMIVADRQWAVRHELQPLARLVSYGVAAVEPGLFGLGPVPAVRQALTRADWSVADVERVELNEAFAAIALVCMRELGFDEEIVNVEGGAIAIGHPIGASGAIHTTRLIHSMQRDGLKRGIVTLCIGGGQGIALALEMLTS